MGTDESCGDYTFSKRTGSAAALMGIAETNCSNVYKDDDFFELDEAAFQV